MANKNIKGITIEIAGDTQKLTKALEGVNKQSKDLQGELRQVERLLKLDPKNTELLTQKQKLLGDAISNTKEKLNTLKEAEKQVQQQFERGEVGEEQYRAIQREVAATEQNLKKLEKQLKETNNSWKTAAENLNKFGEKATDVGKSMTAKVTLPIIGVGTAAVKAGADFEAAMSEVQAISGASGDELTALKEKAKDMGATTKFSASESAEALKYMAMAGWDTQQMLDGLEGVMNLAAASGEDLATVSDIVTDAMTAFGMKASESSKFADLLAKTSSSANTNVSMLGESFKYVAPVFGSLGYSAEDAALALGLMANAGIKSSQAGTTLRSAITRLAQPTDDAAMLLEQLNIQVTDAKGNMLPFSNVMDQLRNSFSKLTTEQQAQYAATIFGQEAMSGMLAIINASESDYQKLAQAVNSYDGVAKKMADTMQNNLQGQLTILKSQLEGVAIQISEILIPVISKIVNKISEWVDWFASLDENTQKTILTVAGLVAAIGPLLIVIGKISLGISSIITLFGGFTAASGAAAAAAGGATAATGGLGAALAALTSPVGIAIAAIAGIAAIAVLVIKNWDKVKEFFTTLLSAIKSKFETTVNAIGSFLSNSWETIKNTVLDKWNSIKNFVLDTVDAIKNSVPAAFESMKNKIANVWEKVKGVIKTPLNAIISTINSFIEKLNGLKIPDWVPVVGGKGINIPKISMLAKGSDFFSGGYAVVGEQGPELVQLPRGSKVYPNGETMGMLGDSISINIQNMTVHDETDIHKISRELYELIERSKRSRGIRR
jgi:TP901 family phage tail tape measure protein